MSVAGGLPIAVDRAALHGCRALQIFTRPTSQWRARPLESPEIQTFRQKAEAAGLVRPVSHASYLINLATDKPALRRQSIEAFADEIDRAEVLGLLGVVLHPGSYTDGTEEHGLRLIADALRDLLAARAGGRALVLLEHTAGQGTALGYRFEQIATLLAHLDGHPRIGVCLDTCHLLAAGYDLCSHAGYDATFAEFDHLIGVERIAAFHLNDSVRELGSRVDRHARIGAGCLGIEPFRFLLNDPRFSAVPMYLETPKGEHEGEQLDAINLRTLRELVPIGQAERA
jgi:deoxyribonuclease-4